MKYCECRFGEENALSAASGASFCGLPTGSNVSGGARKSLESGAKKVQPAGVIKLVCVRQHPHVKLFAGTFCADCKEEFTAVR